MAGSLAQTRWAWQVSTTDCALPERLTSPPLPQLSSIPRVSSSQGSWFCMGATPPPQWQPGPQLSRAAAKTLVVGSCCASAALLGWLLGLSMWSLADSVLPVACWAGGRPRACRPAPSAWAQRASRTREAPCRAAGSGCGAASPGPGPAPAPTCSEARRVETTSCGGSRPCAGTRRSSRARPPCTSPARPRCSGAGRLWWLRTPSPSHKT
mmetsp:Transcript_52814/g.150575  ORF Transcript_52814/g.150575 Transcript_52814/m.150575 type:complete len:210 (-) Transcript_52814:421-1050(-)